MNSEMEHLIQKCVDGVLSVEERQRLDAHLRNCPQDEETLRDLQRQTQLIRASVPDPTPEALQRLLDRAKRPPRRVLPIAASIAIFAVGVGVGALLPLKTDPNPTGLRQFAEQAEAAHQLYVSEVLHPVEVAASEKDHLQAWLSKRLGAPVIAPQLGESGYALIGGRLLPAGDRAAALFMYENPKGDRLSLFATHVAKAQDQSFRFQEKDGYVTVYWQVGPWQYSLVGENARAPLDQIARLIYGQLI